MPPKHQMKTVALDFDGCIHSYTSGWTGYKPLDGPEPGALEFVHALHRNGFRVVVMSTRAHNAEGEFEIKRWLLKYGFPALEVTSEKTMAIAYVDDRAVPYHTGSGKWKHALKRIHELAELAAKTDVIKEN